MTSLERNKALVYRFFIEGVSGRNLDVVDEVMAPDLMDHRFGLGDITGTEGTKRIYGGGFLTAFPDGKAEQLALVAEGDDVFWLGWGTATHTGGPFLGVEPTGKRLAWAAWDYFHVVGGRIVERWGTHAALNRMQQMGVIPCDTPPNTERPVVPYSTDGVTERVRERNKGVVWRFYHEVVNQQRLGAIDELTAEDVVDRRDDSGREGMKARYAEFVEAFPDDGRALYVTMIADGNLVFWLGTATGTHTGGPLLGVERTGKRLTWRAMTLFRLEDGRIAELWGQHDETDLMSQLGILPDFLQH